MKCREFVDFIAEFLDDNLPSEQRELFKQHRDRCPPCLEYLQTYRTSMELGRSALLCENDEIPADVPQRLIDAIKKTQQG